MNRPRDGAPYRRNALPMAAWAPEEEAPRRGLDPARVLAAAITLGSAVVSLLGLALLLRELLRRTGP